MQKKIETYLLLLLGSIIYAIGMSQFLDPNHLAPGGVGGLAIILNEVTSVATGTWIFLINIPILLIGLWQFKWRFICSTVYVVVVSSACINFCSRFGMVTDDLLLAALGGGILSAVGLGIVFKCGSTSGGVDIIVKILRRKFPYLKTSTIFMLLDVAIIILSAVVFKDYERAMYAGISAFVHSLVFDAVLYGTDSAKMIILISDKSEELRKALLDTPVGFTLLHGEGGFYENDKRVILSVMRKQVYPQIEAVVKEIDPDAFLIVTSASEVYGEGYKNIFMEKL